MLMLLRSSSPIFLTAAWRWLAVFNYQIEPQLLAPYLPPGTELDFDEQGHTYISLVGFRFENTRVLGLRIPGHVNFEELNLRFYVRRQEGEESRRGVVFIKELVGRLAISTVARWGYNENYFTVPMRHRVEPGDACAQRGPHAQYEFHHQRRWQRLGLRCVAESHVPANDSHEAFILEHYWGYCRQRDGGTVEYRVTHPRWRVWPAEATDIACDFTPVYGAALGQVLQRSPCSAFLVDGSEVSVAKPRRIELGKEEVHHADAEVLSSNVLR